jgi:hypothetical protein
MHNQLERASKFAIVQTQRVLEGPNELTVAGRRHMSPLGTKLGSHMMLGVLQVDT